MGRLSTIDLERNGTSDHGRMLEVELVVAEVTASKEMDDGKAVMSTFTIKVLIEIYY